MELATGSVWDEIVQCIAKATVPFHRTCRRDNPVLWHVDNNSRPESDVLRIELNLGAPVPGGSLESAKPPG